MSHVKFKRLMTHRYTITEQTRNTAGDLVDGVTYTDIPGFTEYAKSVVVNTNGEQVTAGAIVFFDDTAPINANTILWRVEQIAPFTQTFQVLKVEPISDPRSGKLHHYEIYTR